MAYSPDAASRVKLGTCQVSYAGFDLGLTKGGVEVTVATETYKVMVDQLGNTEINEFIIGRTVSIKVPLAETHLEKLQLVIPGAELIVQGNKRKLVVPTSVGRSLLENAGKLVCHPVALPFTDKSQDFVVPLCSPKGEFTFGYKLNEERIYPVDFTGYTNLEDGTLFYFGDDTTDPTDGSGENWILNAGVWDDTLVWNDTSVWKDA